MKFSVDSKKMTTAVANVSKAISGKSTLPCLSGVYIETLTDGKIRLTGYDLEIGIITEVDAVVEEDGAILLEAKTLLDMLKQFDGAITFTTGDKQVVHLAGKGCSYKMQSYDVKEYPELATSETEVTFEVNQKTLSDMIKQTKFAVSIDTTKGAHCGTRFELSSNQIRLVALDGYRLALRTEEIAYYDEETAFVVPINALTEVANLSLSPDNDIIVEKQKHHAKFVVDDYTIVTRLLTGDFLDYNRVVPATNTISLELKTTEFKSNINRCSVVINDKEKSPIKITLKDNNLECLAETTRGVAKTDMDTEYDGNEFIFGFNNRFMLDVLSALSGEETFNLKLNKENTPILITSHNDTKKYVILPVRI